MRIDVHHHNQVLERGLERLERALSLLTHGVNRMATAQEDFNAAVDRLTTEVGESVTAIQTLAQAVRDNAGNNPALKDAATKLQAMADRLDSAQQAATDATPPAA